MASEHETEADYWRALAENKAANLRTDDRRRIDAKLYDALIAWVREDVEARRSLLLLPEFAALRERDFYSDFDRRDAVPTSQPLTQEKT